MKVKIEARRDYELHIKKVVSKLTVSNKIKASFRKIAMHCFDDGVKFKMDNLCIEVGD